VPQIEVTFDIDANGIVNVSAKDQATNKEQKITITGSSGLSEAEVQRMVQEAELHAEEDNRRREAIALRNDAEAMAFQAEKTLADYGDRVPSELKAELDGKIQAVREVLNSDPENVDRLRTAHEELVQTLTRVGSSMYEAAGAAGPEGEPGADFGTNGTNGATNGATDQPADDATVEGEFREVGADR